MTPSVEQLRAVRLALERATAQGVFTFYAPMVRTLPTTRIVWDADFLTSDAQGALRIEDDGSATIALRTNASPFSLVRTMLHELAHANDVPAILRGMSREVTEINAARAAELARDVFAAAPWLCEP
jgi:hypothetical protein